MGVTTLELMPVHHHSYDRHLVERGLANYWGYNTLAFFAPDIRYAASRTGSGAVAEFKTMVRALHAAGIEVILDVVYNHTAEGNQLGPTLSLRGIDNAAYYRLGPDNLRYYEDFTGCGNTLNMRHPRVLQLFMDSLRYWVLDMHVDGGTVSDLASRLAGSADLYADSGRRPHASINFVTSHDGFTLHDLVSYEQKHNEANGDDNRDGDNNNLSWNGGVEGPTDDAAIDALRWRQKRNFIATLFLSQGVPMISGGDELSRTQRGNNNAYCQDNDISWTHWKIGDAERSFFEFVCRASRLMQEHVVLRRRRFFQGRAIRGASVKDIMWLAPTRQEMSEAEWNADHVRCLGVRLAGDNLGETDELGRPIQGDSLVYLLNAGGEPVPFALPAFKMQPWRCLMDTFDSAREGALFSGGASYPLADRSVAIFVMEPA